VPVFVKVTICTVGIFRPTSPNETLVVSTASVPAEVVNCREKVLDTEPATAERVTFCVEVTDEIVAVKLAVEEPAATAIELGTVTAELLLERPTVNPPLAAAVFKTTVQESVPAPAMDEFVHENAASTGTPVPLSDMVLEPPVDESLVNVNCPFAAPATEGSNCTVNDADWFGPSVSGKVPPVMEKPAPETVAEFTVTEPLPEELNVTV